MNFSFGDIYYADCNPSFGHEYKGKRPVIVVQEESISASSPLVTIIPLITQLDQRMAEDIIIEKNTLNSLSTDSIIKVRNIQSFDKRRFFFKIGRAESPVIRKVRGYLRRHFGM